MQFCKLLAAASTLALASATVEFTNTVFAGISAGKPFVITWQGATGPVTLKLKTGPSTDQVFVSNIATGLTGTSFTWTPPSTTPDATYNFEIDSGTEFNYSLQFEITGGTGTTSTASASGSSSTTSSSGSTTSSGSNTSSSGSSTSSASIITSTSSRSSTSGSSSKSGSSTASAATSVPTSNSAIQNGSPFALVIMGALAIAGLN